MHVSLSLAYLHVQFPEFVAMFRLAASLAAFCILNCTPIG